MKKNEPAPSTEERAEKLLQLFEAKAREMEIGSERHPVRPEIEAIGFPRAELALVAFIAYASGAITGGRLHEELREAFVRDPQEWQSAFDVALAMWRLQAKEDD